MKLIVGLGNVGKEYKNTRHNIGFDFIDNYLGNITYKSNNYGSYYIKDGVIFLKPSTFMNLSGTAIRYFMNYYKIDHNNILIIYDDFNIKAGRFKIKYKSSSGGHNGIKSIIENIKTDEFLRIKIGILSENIINKTDFVLGKLKNDEKEIIFSLEKTINNVINDFINNKDPEYIMNKYN